MTQDNFWAGTVEEKNTAQDHAEQVFDVFTVCNNED